jgi:hypothetical protein
MRYRPLEAGLCLVLCAVCLAKSPGLRPDDNDPNVGGAGRDSTCPVAPSEGAHARLICFFLFKP